MAEISFLFGPFELCSEPLDLFKSDVQQRISGRALQVLLVLVRSAGELVTQSDLMRQVWPDAEVDEGNLRVHVAALRKLLGHSDDSPCIVNQTGSGYRFVRRVERRERIAGPAKGHPIGSAKPHGYLPLRLTRLIGRDQALRELADQLVTRRALTIVGPGGAGKTSVAMALAARSAARYPDGVWFVDLSTHDDGALVASSIASVLRLPVVSDAVETELVDALKSRDMLLLLDNCEHVSSAVALLGNTLLASCPKLQVLATSRQPTGMAGENVWDLKPLDLPAADDASSGAAAMSCSAVQLFVERLRETSDEVELDDQSIQRIIEICRSLDGLPLAIELAAAYARTLGVDSLDRQLRDRLLPLSLGPRIVERHRSLRSLLDWGWDLMSPPASQLLARVAVFRGSFDAEGAAALGRPAEPPDSPASSIAPPLHECVQKSLVVEERDADGLARYRLLETTRAHALARLEESGTAGAIRLSHARHLHALFTRPNASGPVNDRSAWRDGARRIDDIRSALDWTLGGGNDVTLGIDLLIASAGLWLGTVQLSEFARRIDGALDALLKSGLGGDAREMQLQMLRSALAFNVVGLNADRARALRRALEIARNIGAKSVEITALWTMMGNENITGNYLAMHGHIDQIAAISDAGDAVASSMVFRLRALADSRIGHLNQSLMLGAAAINLAKPKSSTERVHLRYDPHATALANQAFTLWLRGRLDDAVDAIARAVPAARELRDPPTLCYILAHLAMPVWAWSGDDAQIQRSNRELIDLSNEHGFPFYRTFARAYDVALRLRQNGSDLGSPKGREDVVAQPQLHKEILVTIAPILLDGTTLSRARQGLTGWSTSAMLRAAALERHRQDGVRAQAEITADLVQAWSVATTQGSVTWQVLALESLLAQDSHAIVQGVPVRDRLAEAVRATQGDERYPHIARAMGACGLLQS